jgi:hypothetical protein
MISAHVSSAAAVGSPACGGRFQVDMAPGLAGLGNQLQVGKLVQQRAGQCGAFAVEHQDIERRKSDRQLPRAACAIGKYLDFVLAQQGEAVEVAHTVLIIVEDGNFHGQDNFKSLQRMRNKVTHIEKNKIAYYITRLLFPRYLT